MLAISVRDPDPGIRIGSGSGFWNGFENPGESGLCNGFCECSETYPVFSEKSVPVLRIQVRFLMGPDKVFWKGWIQTRVLWWVRSGSCQSLAGFETLHEISNKNPYFSCNFRSKKLFFSLILHMSYLLGILFSMFKRNLTTQIRIQWYGARFLSAWILIRIYNTNE